LRHASRFGITSFIYQARRPFHPERIHLEFFDKFFIIQDIKEDEKKTEEGRAKRKSIGEQKKEDKQRDIAVKKQQRAANVKQDARREKFGDLFRSKGFFWLPTRHDLMGVMSQAGSVMNIEFPDRWITLQEKAWEGSEELKAAARKDWVAPYGDRRQDLVFIGKDLNDRAIQELLDNCLLTDEEMAMGPDGWKALWGDVFLDRDDSADEDGE